MIKSNIKKSVLQNRKPSWFILVVLFSLVWVASSTLHAAPTAAAITAQIEAQLHGTIAAATTDDLIKAMEALIAQDPKNAPVVITVLGQAHRTSRDCEISKFVGVALAALGDKATRPVVTAIVQNAVTAEPKCAPAIVTAAIKNNPAFADDIVETAVAALPDPTILIGDITITEAITKAAFAALDTSLPPVGEGPGGDATGILGAANLGLQTSLAAFYARTLGTQPAPDFQTASNVVSGPTTPAPATPQ